VNDSKNMILAAALSVLVLIGWTWVADRYFPAANPPSSKIVNGKQQPVQQAESQPSAPATPKALRSVSAALAATPRVSIRTPSLSGSINLKGAQIDDLLLLNETQTIAPSSPPVRLLSPLGTPGAYIAEFGWTAQGAQVPTLDTMWTTDSQQLVPGHPVTLSTDMPGGMRYQIKIGVDDGYLFTIQQSASNGSGRPAILHPDGLVSRASKSTDYSSWTNHVGPIGVFGGAANYRVTFDSIDGQQASFFSRLFGSSAPPGPYPFQSDGGWTGFTDKYWLAGLIPSGPFQGSFRRAPSGAYQADYALTPANVAPGQTLTSRARLFAGAKEKSWLDRYEDAGIPKLSKSIDWGWFEWFMRPIFDLLLKLFQLTGNFGVAIMCLTLIVRGIMFPVAHKQFQSMAAMRKLQPKMKAIQARYKDDKQEQQKQILKLYQEEKVNPAAGCLPILLQIPIFFALYKVLLISVEMRHQPFILWIKDLAAPDPLTPVNLFGLLHFTPPAFLAIGLLPILVGATQWATMKLNPQPMDPTQAQMFAIMPWVMVFFFAPLAAGIQLYYVTSGVLTILQQWWLYRRFGLHLSDTHPVAT
jgi:YidC/Oxa1 family membrane protein insertase